MKNLAFLISFIFLINTWNFAQDSLASVETMTEPTTALTVQLEGLKSDEGDLMIALYDSSANWLSKSIMGKISDIVDGKATVVFEEVPYGIYAISSFHDEDSNGKLNSGVFGIPTEPYASSRGAKGRFGPPKWEDAKFELNSDTAAEVIKF